MAPRSGASACQRWAIERRRLSSTGQRDLFVGLSNLQGRTEDVMQQIWPFYSVMFGIDTGHLHSIDLGVVAALVGTLSLQF
jgi:hypothetical protein